jgi:hypothetical protein
MIRQQISKREFESPRPPRLEGLIGTVEIRLTLLHDAPNGFKDVALFL